MTTDTVAKGCSRQLEWGGRTITITGIAKGSGMIRPDMATMLAFVVTDAAAPETYLRELLSAAVEQSFHCITVDGDTSTNDACLLAATGQSGVVLAPGHPAEGPFRAALGQVCTTLAQAIVRDGEGATKLMTIEVNGGRDVSECRQVGFTVAHSPLVKTAFYASDPNWGRILAAVGRAGLDGLVLERVGIHLDEVSIVRDGGRDPDYREEDGQRVMARPEITVRIELRRGERSARLWTTDLSHEYVRINAEYRT
jgi:glutamate N-acetyltransferase/amino-acid N-acetyltransferase